MMLYLLLTRLIPKLLYLHIRTNLESQFSLEIIEQSVFSTSNKAQISEPDISASTSSESLATIPKKARLMDYFVPISQTSEPNKSTLMLKEKFNC